ncbi:Hpt domain-containing protein [Caulobacter sp. RL271]|uniref:PAS domain S-box protein n=1 Tax=Caulobacter segnis TaxID=88688 RepID=A0ABY4ZRR9_9CAUL|nr:PAS domain S-box protein [Caulobacter segnis]USQ95507.1 PAS domain S-box protein [Caulobacter segnis]
MAVDIAEDEIAILRARLDHMTRLATAQAGMFQTAFQHAPIGMALVGADGRLVEVNDALRDLIGYPAEDGRAPDLQAIAHPDDVERVRDIFDRLIAGPPIDRLRWRARHGRTGAWTWLESTPVLMRDPLSGAPTGYLDVLRDVPVQQAREHIQVSPAAGARISVPVQAEPESDAGEAARRYLVESMGATAVRSLLAILVAQLDSCFGQTDVRTVREDAHALAGSSGMMGFLELSRTCRALEAAIDTGADHQAALAVTRGLVARTIGVARRWEAELAAFAEASPPRQMLH